MNIQECKCAIELNIVSINIKLYWVMNNYKQFFNTTAQQVIDYCVTHNIAYHIKN